jgi:hypothetical protein
MLVETIKEIGRNTIVRVRAYTTYAVCGGIACAGPYRPARCANSSPRRLDGYLVNSCFGDALMSSDGRGPSGGKTMYFRSLKNF